MTSTKAPKKLKKANSTARPELAARDVEIQKLLEELDRCQSELDALNEQASEEILIVEQRFNKIRKPCFDKRAELIKNVPNFWATAFINNPDLSSMLTNATEEDIFTYLNKVEVAEAADIKSGFHIEFHFTENPYFTNKVLIKEYILGFEGIVLEEPTIVSTAIDWKPGVDYMFQQHIPADQDSRKRKFHERSFFQWFCSDDLESISDTTADIIKDDLWQNPLQYFQPPDADDEGENDEKECNADEEEEIVLPQVNNHVGSESEDPLQ